MVNKKAAQEWLDSKYENKKEEIEEISFEMMKFRGEEAADTELEGEMLIDGYSNLKEISFSGAKGITKLTIENCLNVEIISLYGNPIAEMPWLNELTKLRRLNCGDTKISEIDIRKNTQLERLTLHKNEQKIKIKGLKDFVKKLNFWNSIGTMVFPWEQILVEDLKEIAREELGMEEEKMKDKTAEQIKGLIAEEMKKLQEVKDKIQQAEGFGLTEWDNLAGQTQNETLSSLLGRPTRNELEKVEKERDQRPNATQDEYNKLLNNQKPDKLPANWQEQLNRIPDLDKVQAKLDKIKGSIKGLLGLDNLPADWESKLVNKNDLEQANQKVQDYENGLKTSLDLDDKTLPNWKDEIDKLKNLPTSDNSDQIKDELEAVRKGLKEWEDKFPDKTADQVKKENKKAKTADDLQKELNGWKGELVNETPETAAKKIVEAGQTKNELNNWQGIFPNTTPDKVIKELNDLKSKAADTTPNAEQQQKIDDLKKLVERQKEAIKKYLVRISVYADTSEFNNEVLELSKDYQKLIK